MLEQFSELFTQPDCIAIAQDSAFDENTTQVSALGMGHPHENGEQLFLSASNGNYEAYGASSVSDTVSDGISLVSGSASFTV